MWRHCADVKTYFIVNFLQVNIYGQFFLLVLIIQSSSSYTSRKIHVKNRLKCHLKRVLFVVLFLNFSVAMAAKD